MQPDGSTARCPSSDVLCYLLVIYIHLTPELSQGRVSEHTFQLIMELFLQRTQYHVKEDGGRNAPRDVPVTIEHGVC